MLGCPQDMVPAGTSSPFPIRPQSPSRKRLLADLKPPKNGSSSSSALSSDQIPDRCRKKTRDLPNFSDCHGCGVHVNTTNPRERLQVLESLWRIVLLCRKCVKLVDSAESCSYCFSPADSDCYECPKCDRRIHRDCVDWCKSSAPWSYCGLELGFSVCVDCWVPKLLSVSNKNHNRSKKNPLKHCLECKIKASTDRGSVKSVEDTVDDAKSVVEKKTLAAAKAEEKVLQKALVAGRAVELANSVLELVSEKDVDGEKNECSLSCTTSGFDNAGKLVLDDAELAIRLHCTMNSSPRMPKKLLVVHPNPLPVLAVRDDNGNLLVRSEEMKGRFSFTYQRRGREGSNSRLSNFTDVCTKEKSNEKTEVCLSEPSICVKRPFDNGSFDGVGGFKNELLVYRRKCKRGSDSQENGEGISENGTNQKNLIFENQTCDKKDELDYELCFDKSRNQSHLTCDGNSVELHSGLFDGKLDGSDRYLLKYRKRGVRSKETMNRGVLTLCDESGVENFGKHERIPQNSAAEGCRTSPGPSFLSCTVDLPVSGSASSTLCDTTGVRENPQSSLFGYEVSTG